MTLKHFYNGVNNIEEVAQAYTAVHPVDGLGKTHVKMVRLEFEAYAL